MPRADCGFPTPPPDSFEGKPKTRPASGNHPLTFGFWRWGPLHRVSPPHTAPRRPRAHVRPSIWRAVSVWEGIVAIGTE